MPKLFECVMIMIDKELRYFRQDWRHSMGEYDELLKELGQQEEVIQFASFSNDTALAVGMALVKAAREKGKAVTVDITRGGQQLFHFAMAGTSIDNGEWVKRKNRVVNRFGHSSYYMGIYLKNAGHP